MFSQAGLEIGISDISLLSEIVPSHKLVLQPSAFSGHTLIMVLNRGVLFCVFCSVPFVDVLCCVDKVLLFLSVVV